VHEPPTRSLALITILLTLLGWTTIPLFLRSFIEEVDGWTANGWRYAISALIWAPVLLIAWRRGSWPRGLWRAALVPSLFNAAGQACFGLAPYYIEPGLMTFSLRLQIVFVTVGAAIMFPAERRVIRSTRFLLGVVMVVGGTAATLLLDPDGLGSGTGRGIALAVASGLLYAAYALAVRRSMTGINPIQAFAAVSQFTALILVALMLAVGERSGARAFDLSAGSWGMLVLSSLIGIGLGHTFYFYSIARLGLAVSAGVVQLQPVTVSIASMFIFGEKLTLPQWSFGLLAITGAVLMLSVQQRVAKKVDVVLTEPAE